MSAICGNCRHDWVEGDRYCRYCGAPVGIPRFVPEGPMPCIYGPEPVPREHKCVRCGYTWETDLMIDREDYCPRCGGKAPGRELPGRRELPDLTGPIIIDDDFQF